MISMLSFGRRALRRATVALASVAVLAACDTNRSLEPSAPRIPTAAQPALGADVAGALSWTVYTNQGGKLLLGGAKFKLTGTNVSMTVTDNGLFDEDPTLGRFKLADLKPGSIKVCQITPPSGYLMADPSCRQVTVYANATTVTEFKHAHKPVLLTDVRNASKQLVGGAVITIKDSVGAAIMVVTDNDAKDLDKTAGSFTVIMPAGKHTVCPTTPPPGMTFGPIVCYTTTFKYGVANGLGPFWVYPL